MSTPVFGPGCPWFDLHARFPPNIDWCEEKLCAVVVTSFNSWTNLANLRPMNRWPDGARGYARYWMAVAAMTALTALSFWVGIAAQLYVGLLILLIIATELTQQTLARHFFWASVSMMVVASVLSALDLTRTVCDAANHWLQLYGLWHVLTAVAIYLAFLHIRLATHQPPGSPTEKHQYEPM